MQILRLNWSVLRGLFRLSHPDLRSIWLKLISFTVNDCLLQCPVDQSLPIVQLVAPLASLRSALTSCVFTLRYFFRSGFQSWPFWNTRCCSGTIPLAVVGTDCRVTSELVWLSPRMLLVRFMFCSP